MAACVTLHYDLSFMLFLNTSDIFKYPNLISDFILILQQAACNIDVTNKVPHNNNT